VATIREQIRDLSQRPHLVDATVELEESAQVTPGFLRVTVSGAELAAYTQPRPADAFKLTLPGPAGDPVLRAFTVSGFDAGTRQLTFDVAGHDDAPATVWARTARAGDEVRLFGMRRDWALGDDAFRHLVVADPSSLPAAAAIVASLPDGLDVTVVAETVHAEDRTLLPVRRGVRVRWVTGPTSRGIGSPLERAVRELRPAPDTQVWLAAESGVVRALRRHLLQERGIDRMRLQAAAYWMDGVDSTRRDAVAEAVYRRAMTAGLDVTDPATQDDLEFADS
jgi:NADPH-dependent ferric siderophore reductase